MLTPRIPQGRHRGLVGGGGSVLAVPLLVYFVGLHDPHLAIGTSAVAVTVNAALSLAAYARAGQVKWPCSLTFATAGILGAFVGSTLGKAINGQHLLALFAAVMIASSSSRLSTRRGFLVNLGSSANSGRPRTSAQSRCHSG